MSEQAIYNDKGVTVTSHRISVGANAFFTNQISLSRVETIATEDLIKKKKNKTTGWILIGVAIVLLIILGSIAEDSSEGSGTAIVAVLDLVALGIALYFFNVKAPPITLFTVQIGLPQGILSIYTTADKTEAESISNAINQAMSLRA